MPLIKRTDNVAGAVPSALSAAIPTDGASLFLPPDTRKVKVPAMTKDGYWERKEARDIRTGECIRLSGVLQALLSSVNYGQYCTTSDKVSYLAEVKKDAKELAKFITDEA